MWLFKIDHDNKAQPNDRSILRNGWLHDLDRPPERRRHEVPVT